MIDVSIEKQIGNKYGGFNLRVETKFHSNSITRIMGPSGVGKTTLLKMIAGLILPDNGRIKVDDVLWFDRSKKYSKKVQERKVGFVFQDYALFPNMSVEQHLLFGTDDLDYVRDLLELGEMQSFGNRYPRELSGGQQQRLAILRALSTKPSLLLMDEPFSAMDKELKYRFIKNLAELFAEQQATVLLVTHQDNELDGVISDEFEMKSVQ
ncbi:ATP-binding cassette domain-containing protein [Pedobacter nototheniae]|uniref:ATP-binding cassette domain-containing protein n=1 Tax=Pedobacter nototheniae TaxID=2488994 RepID=UPI00292D923C|nr:ATP-binding cassette domain-containing protein [Pedobacter nototheniae]